MNNHGVKRACLVFSFLLVLMLSVVLLNGCDYYGAGKDITRRACFTLTSYAIPGGYAEVGTQVNVRVLEEDDYGRVLFATDAYAGEPAIAVIQNYDYADVYYYDNICYVSTEEYKRYDEEQLERLKENNDWNEELQYDKMIRRKMITESFEHDLKPVYYESCKKFVEECESITLPDGYTTKITFCDKSANGQELYYIRTCFMTKTRYIDRNQQIYYYLMVIDENGSYNEDTYLINIEEPLNSNYYLSKIKEMNGWVA